MDRTGYRFNFRKTLQFREEGYSNQGEGQRRPVSERELTNSESVTVATESVNPSWSGACSLKRMDLIAFLLKNSL